MRWKLSEWVHVTFPALITNCSWLSRAFGWLPSSDWLAEYLQEQRSVLTILNFTASQVIWKSLFYSKYYTNIYNFNVQFAINWNGDFATKSVTAYVKRRESVSSENIRWVFIVSVLSEFQEHCDAVSSCPWYNYYSQQFLYRNEQSVHSLKLCLAGF